MAIGMALAIGTMVLILALLLLFGTLATVEICESNTSSETITHNITNLNIGSNDSANLTPATYPLSPSTRSYEKWVRFHVSANPDTNTLDNWKVWISTGSNPQSNVTFRTNCTETGYGGAQTYDTTSGPQNTDRESTYDYDHDAPTSEPTGPNLGEGGVLGDPITTTGYTDYCIIQGVVGSAATEGDSVTWTFAYDETA